MAVSADLAAQAGLSQDVQQKLRIDELKRNLTPRPSEEKRLREACQGFEAVFLNKMIQQMRATVPKGGFLHSSYEDQYQSMFDQELAEKMAKDGGIGLGQMLFDQVQGNMKKNAPTGVDQDRDIYSKTAFERMPKAKNPLYTKSDIVPSDPGRPFPSQEKANGEKPSRIDLSKSDNALPGALPGQAMAAPSRGEISSEFGWRTDPFHGRRAWHAGVDIKAQEGSPVAACWDGKVVFSGDKPGLGHAVVVEHEGGWQSIYGHNKRNLVKEGDSVRSGQQIAEIGDTGRSTGAHLHFELRRDGVAFDPVKVQMTALATGEKPRKTSQLASLSGR